METTATRLGPQNKALVVGVTAFGLYAETHDFNASNIVLDALPNFLEGRSPRLQRINIVKYPNIHVTYDEVTKAVHDIWDPRSSVKWAEAAGAAGLDDSQKNDLKIDFVLHLGQMRSFPGYSLERLGHRDGYERLDLDSQAPLTRNSPTGVSIEPKFETFPDVLRPDFDVESLVNELKRTVPNTLIRASTKAGRFTCEYLFYSSMAELWKRRVHKRVLFLHVPAKDKDDDIRTGVEVVTNLILSVAELLTFETSEPV